MDLVELREQIDRVDTEMVALFEERMRICAQVAEDKQRTGKPVFDKEREQQKLQKVKALVQDPDNSVCVEELFEQMMSMSRKLQYRKINRQEPEGKSLFQVSTFETIKEARVVFQGAEGSYSQAAMQRFFGKDIYNFSVDTFTEAMTAIRDKKADYAVLPIENSTAGSVNEIYDLLTEFDYSIIGEQIIPIVHCLMGIPGSRLSDIKTVYSHPQSLMQSAHYLKEHHLSQQIGMQNNAFAARKVMEEQDLSKAAIASEYAAQSYGLTILQKGVNDQRQNATRFIIVSDKKVYREDANVVSISFELPHETGSLYHILSHFIYNNLNMNRIESRPVENKSWEYRFFIDFDGNLSDGAVKNAIAGLKEETCNLRILGNYKTEHGEKENA